MWTGHIFFVCVECDDDIKYCGPYCKFKPIYTRIFWDYTEPEGTECKG